MKRPTAAVESFDDDTHVAPPTPKVCKLGRKHTLQPLQPLFTQAPKSKLFKPSPDKDAEKAEESNSDDAPLLAEMKRAPISTQRRDTARAEPAASRLGLLEKYIACGLDFDHEPF